MIDFLLARGQSARVSATWVFLTALALALMGILAQIAVVQPEADDLLARPLRQLMYVACAGVAGILAMLIGFRRAVEWSRQLLWLTWALLAVLLVPGMPRQHGAARWIDVGPVHIQPSEIAKLAIILFVTRYAIRKGPEITSFFKGVLPVILMASLTAILIRLEPDLGQTLFIGGLAGAMLMVNGARFRHLLPMFGVALLLLGMHAANRDDDSNGYVHNRLQNFLEGGDYQVKQGLRFFALGGATGTGIDDARAQVFVPKIHNDFILVAIGETAGFAGTILVVFLFLALAGHGLRLALMALDRAGFSVAFGISLMIGLQAAVNIAVVTGSVPPKGIALPFLSFGGSSVIVLGASIGLLCSVADAAALPEALPSDSGGPTGIAFATHRGSFRVRWSRLFHTPVNRASQTD